MRTSQEATGICGNTSGYLHCGVSVLAEFVLNGIMILHGSGVGGGSLVFADVLMEPDDKLFSAPAWSHLADWKTAFDPVWCRLAVARGADTRTCFSAGG